MNEEQNPPEEHNHESSNSNDKKSAMAEVMSWVRYLAVAIVAALVIRTYLFTPAIVKGASMSDTLLNGQVMAVVKATYLFTEPKRGDVVFCRYPGWGEDCVKRVIGLPGERLSVRQSVVYIDDQPLDEPYLSRPDAADFEEITIPEGKYFVMGDNRGNSLDSRSIGPLEKNQIEGHCMAVFWPLTDLKTIK